MTLFWILLQRLGSNSGLHHGGFLSRGHFPLYFAIQWSLRWTFQCTSLVCWKNVRWNDGKVVTPTSCDSYILKNKGGHFSLSQLLSCSGSKNGHWHSQKSLRGQFWPFALSLHHQCSLFAGFSIREWWEYDMEKVWSRFKSYLLGLIFFFYKEIV